jgi:hypothetical protein
MVAVPTLSETRISYSRLLHLVSGDFIGGVEEGGESSGRCFHGEVDLVSLCVLQDWC